MLRRPPTTVELKLDDIREYEYKRQQMGKDQEKQSKNFGDTPPPWSGGPKSKEEIYSRIGYAPEKPVQIRTNLL
ncbi:hypothetical protein Zmor_023775 [Zophobas morio]|uniref:Anaphase-promoting complex subunit CDC26 n=1 Tax=Zophobas morio TaxID=2755281 RepID=A0AA38M875_9CUCU|nr:hypothetical protein Zmor_023775 [Zophobas morio]